MDRLGIPFRVYEVQGDDGKTSTTKWTSLDGMFFKLLTMHHIFCYDSITKIAPAIREAYDETHLLPDMYYWNM